MAAQEVNSECRHTLAPQAKQSVWGFRPFWRGLAAMPGQQIWPEQLRNMVNGLLMPVMATAGSEIASHLVTSAKESATNRSGSTNT